jgi:hypothetical protein
MVADLFDPFDSRVGPTKAQQEAWEARKFGTLESLRPMSREECDQAIDKIAQGIDDEQTRRYLEANRIRQPIITPASRTQRFGGKQGRPRVKIDSARVKARYLAGQTVKQIAEHEYLHPDTVRGHLKYLKIYDPSRDKTGGKGVSRNRQEKCPKGHSMDDAYVTTDKKTGREKRDCRTCKLKRNEESRQRRRSRARLTNGEAASDG